MEVNGSSSPDILYAFCGNVPFWVSFLFLLVFFRAVCDRGIITNKVNNEGVVGSNCIDSLELTYN